MIGWPCALGAALVALLPLVAAAASTPSPSLDGVLAAPPAGFSEVTTAFPAGRFTADQYASNTVDSSAMSGVLKTLQADGFVDGYGKTWTSDSAQHILFETAMAFAGGRGAREWLASVTAALKQLPGYQHDDAVSGAGPAYGAHVYDSAGRTYRDDFVFAKGNDVFEVLVISIRDDGLGTAAAQARQQYGSAPAETIPTSQWPENQEASPLGYRAGAALARVVLGLAVLAVIASVGGFLVRRLLARGAPAGPVQLSPDGGFWWDGQRWHDATREVPATAQRSANGAHWWDGRTWRPVPPAPPF